MGGVPRSSNIPDHLAYQHNTHAIVHASSKLRALRCSVPALRLLWTCTAAAVRARWRKCNRIERLSTARTIHAVPHIGRGRCNGGTSCAVPEAGALGAQASLIAMPLGCPDTQAHFWRCPARPPKARSPARKRRSLLCMGFRVVVLVGVVCAGAIAVTAIGLIRD